MRRAFVAFLLVNCAAIYLASAKTVVLFDNDFGKFDAYSSMQQARIGSSDDSDVINFCRMCKSYVDLFQQADDTVEIRMPREDLCNDVEENDQDLCLESIDNLHRLSTFDDLSTVDNLEVCQLVSLCEEMSSSEEDDMANGSDSVAVTGSEEVMEGSEGNVEQLLKKATNDHAHLLNHTHVGVHPKTPHHPVSPAPHHIDHVKINHPPVHNDHSHNGHPHGNGHQHGNGHHNHKHHSGASSNAIISSAVLFSISLLINKHFILA